MSIINDLVVKDLQNIQGLLLQKNVPLDEISSWGVGGNAAALVQPASLQAIAEIRKYLTEHQLPNLVIGNTTNLLFADENIDAVLIKVGSELSDVLIEGHILKAQAGVWTPKLARLAMQAGLTGIEHTCGIPGTLGGLVVMNGGSQRKGIGDHIVCVKTVDTCGEFKTYTKEDCEFGYRSSIFQKLDEVIVEVALQLKKANSKADMHAEMLSILRSRSKKFPRKLPNCGSVFVSNPAMYEEFGSPGKIIESLGFKGLVKGGAQVSTEHANFIVNKGNARASDILYLIKCIRNKIYNETGCLMEVEPKYVSGQAKITNIVSI